MSEHKVPQNMEQYTELAYQNQQITGFGLKTTIHLPCPFCCFPDFMVYKILDAENVPARPHACKCCGRSARCLFNRMPGRTTIEVVQTGGDDQPTWLVPKMRREHEVQSGPQATT